MPVNHRFLQTEFNNGFQTHNAILDVTPYEPKILFVGTYNPLTEANNSADFFYGRRTNWFWPTMKNIFVHGAVLQLNKRQQIAVNPTPVLINPTLPEIFDLCIQREMVFADLIKSVLHHNNPVYNLQDNRAIYQGGVYDLTADNALNQLNNLGQVNWGTEDIIRYIREKSSINCVRLTRQPTSVWQQRWNQIVDVNNYDRQINFGTIHTPAGMGLYEAGIPIAAALARRWLHHPVAHKRLCDQWIEDNDVPVQNFNYPNPPLPLF